MAEGLTTLITRWTAGGILDEETASRIQTFELERAGSTRLRWPMWVALAFGALMLGAGVLLFVSAHWDMLSPQERFGLVMLLVAVFHLAGASVAERFRGMATSLHAVGTVALGAGIFLAGQIFNLSGHWPGSLMLWALGAAIGWALLRDGPQMALAALLAPAWLTSEWLVAGDTRFYAAGWHVAACGSFLLALTYFTARRDELTTLQRQALLWLGGISLLPAALSLALATSRFSNFGVPAPMPLSMNLQMVGWTVALGLPVTVAVALRRLAAWPNLLAVLWVLALINLPSSGIHLYLWWALGATALAWWGCSEMRSERINMGAAIFACTVLSFYFSQVMDKLGRSASLVGLGILFLVGGWALNRVRRNLVLQTRGGQA